MSNNGVWTECRTIVATDGVELCLRACGSPQHPVLLLIHGYPDSSRVWDRLAALLAPNWRVIAYDVRGAGESTTPSSREGYRLGQLSADFFTVLDAIAVQAEAERKKVHVIAHDWGAIQTWESMADPRAKDAVATYTSISGPCLDHVAHLMRSAPIKQPLAALGQVVRSWYVYAFHLPLVPELLWRAPVAKRIFGDRPTLRRDATNGLNLYRANIASRMLRPRPLSIHVPVHLMLLTNDRYVSPFLALSVKPWATDMTCTEIAATHWAQLEQPEEVARALTTYLLGRDSAPTASRATLRP